MMTNGMTLLTKH